jgi:hypothetical protein
MGIYNKHSRKIRWTAILLLTVVVMAGCAGIQPYEPRNNREEGPEKGLFTGSQGEWVILRAQETQQSDSSENTSPDEKEADEPGLDQAEADGR